MRSPSKSRATAFKILAYGGKMWYNRDMEIEKLKKAMADVEDPRRTDRGNIRHKLEDILIIGLCTLISNGNDFVDMEAFGKQREEWLRGFLALPNGIPDSDTFRRVFERLNPEALSECLYDWLGCNREEGSVIAVDGKTIRGSGNESHKAYHVVSAFVAENRVVLGELVTEEKSNEITAVPELLASLNIEGSVVTADAMSCQKKIVEQIQNGGADYVIGLKGNQSALLENVSLYFESFSGELPKLTTRLKKNRKARISVADGFVMAGGSGGLERPSRRWHGDSASCERRQNDCGHAILYIFLDGHREIR